ncbi:MAG TPA: caspase family protein [Polyangiales bacterium]
MIRTTWVLLAVLCWPRAAAADPGVHSYALIVGSNRGGDGQSELSFAQRDADAVASLLKELGRTPAEHIERLKDPTPSAVVSALARLRTKLEAHAAAGDRAQLIFYYSGHARANALSLGAHELPLAELRASLLALPSTLTVVVLDACQSGAFSGVKGASAASDFSVRSVQDLNSTGVAVMASSTASEFSQESRELGSSYFTHHLLVSLRGAGDRDRNGRVSLDEAYAYAYQHTLADTARTQVGSQHATLETALTGRGDVPLSYPVDADAQLALSGPISGKILVQQAGHGAVMAELVKAAGAPLLIALPSGSYEVLVRGDKSARSCALTLSRGTVASLAPEQCQEVQLPEEVAKADDALRESRRLALESWFLELGMSVLRPLDDAYTRRLGQFEYSDTQVIDFAFDSSFGYMLNRYLGLSLRYGIIDQQNFYSNRINANSSTRWITRAVTAGVRARYPLFGRRLVLFGDAHAGAAINRSAFDYGDTEGGQYRRYTHKERQASIALRALAGVDVGLGEHFGIYAAAGYAWAPVLENELDEKRMGGTFTFVVGLRLNGVEGGW